MKLKSTPREICKPSPRKLQVFIIYPSESIRCLFSTALNYCFFNDATAFATVTLSYTQVGIMSYIEFISVPRASFYSLFNCATTSRLKKNNGQGGTPDRKSVHRISKYQGKDINRISEVY